ncbi:MAG: sugar phosphate isomerase/epimerase family protein [Segetibacter sp.]
MNTSRRNFLKNSAVIAGSMTLSNELFAYKKVTPQIVGVQLYSVREDMKKDPIATLKQLKEMGYTYVEHANYVDRKFYGYSASEFKKVLQDNGLKMLSGHTVMGKQHWDETKKDFTDAWKKTVEDAAVVGQEYVISPYLDENSRKSFDQVKRYMDVFNKSGVLCKKSGMKFGYHNHQFEFSTKLNDVKLYDIIMKYTDPKLVVQQLDMGNMYEGGGRALSILKQYPGRFPLLHVKDEIRADKGENPEKYESAVLGTGVVGVKEIVDLAKKIGGTTQFIIEQESYQNKTALESVKEDLDIMKKWGY